MSVSRIFEQSTLRSMFKNSARSVSLVGPHMSETLLEERRDTARQCTEVVLLRLQPKALISDLSDALQQHLSQQQAGLLALAYRTQWLDAQVQQQLLAPFTAADSRSAPRFSATFARRVQLQLRDTAGQLHSLSPLVTDSVATVCVLAFEATG